MAFGRRLACVPGNCRKKIRGGVWQSEDGGLDASFDADGM